MLHKRTVGLTKTSVFVFIIGFLSYLQAQPTQDVTVQPTATKDDCICKKEDPVCYCTLVIEYKLTMILENLLVYPDKGLLKFANNDSVLTVEQMARVITADGQTSRLVISINGRFPGPRVVVWQDQQLDITIVNKLHTEGVSVHFHGLHQKGTPYMDGVAYITQCPILPGQTFVHSFKAFPPGTFFYHAHIGDQRYMGLYGPFIVRPTPSPTVNEIIMSLQDWNNLLDASSAYQREVTGQFDFKTRQPINTTYSVDEAGFGKFAFQSGLINGRGRFWETINSHNGAPLERFKIKSNTRYRFRIIGAMFMYPMRVFIYGQKLTLRSSDAYNMNNITVQSIIVHPGERFDFYWDSPLANEITRKELLLVAETIETPKSLNYMMYHAAEAVLEFEDSPEPVNPDPKNYKDETCTAESKCVTFNCPYKYYPPDENRECVIVDEVSNIDPNQNYQEVVGKKIDEEHFFNFGFPGPKGNTPGSINGRSFIMPTFSLLSQTDALTTACNESCGKSGVCHCTYIQTIPKNKLIQFVLLDLGNGSGASHPIHLHGHSFYVMKVGLGTYNQSTGQLVHNSPAINCTDDLNFCSSATWANKSWLDGKIPGLNPKPPQKDTVILPTGGYVVIRFVSDNPGMWFFHCHIDVHNTNGMTMVISEDWSDPPKPPKGFPTCRNFLHQDSKVSGTERSFNARLVIAMGLVATILLY